MKRFSLFCPSLLLAIGVLNAPIQAQVLDQVTFPMIVEADSLVQGTFDLLAIPGAFEGLKKHNNILMTEVRLPERGEVSLELERIHYDFSAMGTVVNGQPTPNHVGDLTLWKGTVQGDETSEVMLGFSSYGSYGFIKTQGEFHHMIAFAGEGNDWSNAGARIVPDAVMSGLNLPALPQCSNDTTDAPLNTRTVFDLEGSSAGQVLNLGVTLAATIAIETDYEYYSNWNDLTACQNYTNILLAAISDRYGYSIDVNLYYPYVGYWTSNTDPWNAQGAGTSAMLNQFVGAWAGAIPAGANLGHFISGAAGGGLAYLDVLCNDNVGFGVSFGLSGGTQFPVSQSSNTWDFVVVAHELGHNFGSSHTHNWCPVPLDFCAPAANFGACQTFRVCALGTIMSYCHSCAGGMNNITTYFHPEVITVMRAQSVASCLVQDTMGCTVDAFESNDSCAAAVTVSPGTFTGLYSCETDDDWYAVSVPPGAQLTVDLAFTNATADLDLQIRNSSCTTVLDGSYSVSDAESVTWTNTSNAASIVNIRQYMFSNVPTSPYSMMVTVLGCVAPDAYEDNDTCATATPWADGTVVGLSVDKLDKDHYSFCVADGATVTIDLLFITATGDVDGFLRDAASVECGSGNGLDELAQGYTGSDNENIVWTNTTGADLDVVLEVNVWDGSLSDCNTYDMVISGAWLGCGLGTAFCDPATANSAGSPAVLAGSVTAAGAGLHLEITGGVPGQLAYMLVGTSDAGSFTPPGSSGPLCLVGGPFYRYNVGGTSMNSIGGFNAAGVMINAAGTSTTGFGFDVPSTIPDTVPIAIMAGDIWHFQGWYRDTPAMAGGNNFTNGLSVTF
jgi:hypothetical protein